MTQFTIQIKNKEEETFVETFLKKMKIRFEKKDVTDDDFELTDEMKKAIDESLNEDKSKFEDAFESLDRISKKYGI